MAVPVLTDVHEDTPYSSEVAEVVRCTCRRLHSFVQPDQFYSTRVAQQRAAGQHQERTVPFALGHEKRCGNKAHARPATEQIMVCERGASVSVMATWSRICAHWRVMRDTGCPVVFDATHSVQLPGGQGNAHRVANGNLSRYLQELLLPPGVSGLFMETHPAPRKSPERRP